MKLRAWDYMTLERRVRALEREGWRLVGAIRYAPLWFWCVAEMERPPAN